MLVDLRYEYLLVNDRRSHI